MKKALKLICLLVFPQLFTTTHTFSQTDTQVAAMTFINNDKVYDYGGIPQGMSVPYEFEIKNTGTAPLIVSGMICESKNIMLKWPPKAIKPGKKGYLTITYDAEGEIGSFDNNVYVSSNAIADTTALIHITGAITPAGSLYTPPAKPLKTDVK